MALTSTTITTKDMGDGRVHVVERHQSGTALIRNC